MIKTPREELTFRNGLLQDLLDEQGVDLALIVQNADLFYFGGTIQPGCLCVFRSGNPVYFSRKNLDRTARESSLETIVPVRGFSDLRERLADLGQGTVRRAAMELDVLPVNLLNRYREILPCREVVDLFPLVRTIRQVKSEYEIILLRQAAALSDFMVETTRRFLRAGIPEIALAAEVERAARLKGHEGFVRMRAFNQEVYWGHLVSGAEAAEPSYVHFTTGGGGLSAAFAGGSGFRVIREREPVLFDLAAVRNGYHADQSRTFAVGGLPEVLERGYRVSLEIAGVLEEALRAGVTAGDLYGKAEAVARREGLGDHFMGSGRDRAGFCGHGLGLELDEEPVISAGNPAPLRPGMALALEPKFVFPEAGVVGVEDTYVLREKGWEKLTSSGYEPAVEAS
ncbi:MAG TPA: Xaa-Pro peptidase family protein [Syntrophales bacterium]|nr:Xaa-Pro peptidase family protein [Syntrophales bacterium]